MRKIIIIALTVLNSLALFSCKAKDNEIENSSEDKSSAKFDDASFLEAISREDEMSNSGIFFLNIDDEDHNVWLSRTDSASNRVNIGFEDKLGYAVEDGIGLLENGHIRTVELGTLPFEVNIRIISPHHLIMEQDGQENNLYSMEYLEKEAKKVAPKRLDNFEFQIFTVDGNKFAKTNLYGLLTLDAQDTASTIGFFPGSEEGQETTVKFEEDCVTITYGHGNQIVYGNRHGSKNRNEVRSNDASVVIGHTYANQEYGIEWNFINDKEGIVRFSDSDHRSIFRWEEGNDGHIVIYGNLDKVDAGAEVKDNGNKLIVLDFADGSEFTMTRTK